MKWLALIAVVWLASASALGQQTVEDQVRELKQTFSTPVVGWTDDFVKKNIGKLIDIYVNRVIWDPEFYKKVKNKLPPTPPTIQVISSSELRTPYVAGQTIVFPAAYLEYLINISAIVGHDIYGNDNFVPLPRPLLSTPFRVSAISPLLSPIYKYVDVDGFTQIQAYISCPSTDKECTEVQAASASALILFALLHEMSHQYLHHKLTTEGVNLDQELAADKNAYEILLRLLSKKPDPSASDETNKEIIEAYRLAPVAWLAVEASREGIASVVAQRRKETLSSILVGEEKEDIALFTESEEDSNSLSHLSISWNEAPTTLFIDGLATPVASVEGRRLIVASGTHRILALRPGAIAFGKSFIFGDSRLELSFNEFKAPDLAMLEEKSKRQEWFDVLLMTTDEQLHPKSPGLAAYHWEALHELGFDNLISIQEWNDIPEADWKKYRRWQVDGVPLSSWYVGMPR
jgi:hypothetical protein